MSPSQGPFTHMSTQQKAQADRILALMPIVGRKGAQLGNRSRPTWPNMFIQYADSIFQTISCGDIPKTIGQKSIWLVVSYPLKNMKVNWDDEIPNIWENKSHVPVTTNQLWQVPPISSFLSWRSVAPAPPDYQLAVESVPGWCPEMCRNAEGDSRCRSRGYAPCIYM